MSATLLAIVAVVALASTVVVVGSARATANGLPSYTDGWQKWPRSTRSPSGTRALSSAHTGLKNVYASKRKVGSKYPNGTVIVKTIVKPGTKYVGQFATMRKVSGRWRFIEYERRARRSATRCSRRFALYELPRAGEVERLRLYQEVSDGGGNAAAVESTRYSLIGGSRRSASVPPKQEDEAHQDRDDPDENAEDSADEHEQDPNGEERDAEDEMEEHGGLFSLHSWIPPTR